MKNLVFMLLLVSCGRRYTLQINVDKIYLKIKDICEATHKANFRKRKCIKENFQITLRALDLQHELKNQQRR